MPYKIKKRRRRRPYKRRKGAMTLYQKGPTLPLGRKMFKFKTRYFARNISLNGGVAGIVGGHVFSCNGLYDPDISGTGHQPIGFDQVMQMYDHYVVIGAQMRLDVVNTSGTYSQMVGVALSDKTSLDTDPTVYIENSGNKYITLGPKGSNRDTGSITMQINPSKFLGRTKPLSDPELKGTIAANPTEQAYFQCWVAPTQTVDTDAVNANILIEYVAVLIEPRKLALS